MGAIFEKLGIDTASLIAQGINFGLLLLILWKFLYKPVMNVLDARTSKIEESLRKADEIAKEYDEIEKKKEDIILKAKSEASRIIDEARAEAKTINENAHLEAETNAKTILLSAELDGEKKKKEIISDTKDDIARLVEESLTSLLKNNANKYDDALINEALAGFVEKV